ncbi:MAG: hypothetical protein KatS3mg042_0753 [Rhodothermaceae bacterium]|nr:MAG: hypothetical protein KatS3mg042_0753 [Rhodothermaceae bacterium]
MTADQRLHIVEEGLHVVATPEQVPLVIPPEGTTFSYTVSLTNHTGTTRDVDFWTHITGPDGISLVRGPVPVSLAPGASLSKTLSQKVPASAPAGIYTLTAKTGTFPIAEQTDTFTFTKEAAGTAAARR